MSGVLMTQDRHYSDHPRHYVSLKPGNEPRLTACRVSMLPTLPLGGEGEYCQFWGTILLMYYWQLCEHCLVLSEGAIMKKYSLGT